nr:hypothetical protein [Apis mellifera nudivirus]
MSIITLKIIGSHNILSNQFIRLYYTCYTHTQLLFFSFILHMLYTYTIVIKKTHTLYTYTIVIEKKTHTHTHTYTHNYYKIIIYFKRR